MRSPFALGVFVAAIAAVTCGSIAQAQVADFGSPPSGAVPILFNDHHVYAKPDELKRGRLLAALVRGKTILVPLRSMFEQFGATVSYDAASQTVFVRKSGDAITLVIGKASVDIDGTTRPLDVPPEIYHGCVLVPVRVITEALGGYVQYVPSLRVVVVRYESPTAVAPAAPPAQLPPVTAPATARPRPYIPPGAPIPHGPPPSEAYVVVDETVGSTVDDPYSPGQTVDSGRSFAIHGAAEFDLFGANMIFGGDATREVYDVPKNGSVKQLDGTYSFVPAFVGDTENYDVFLGAQIFPAPGDVYLDVSYENLFNNYGYPHVGGVGVGLLKVPNFRNRLSFGGSLSYYPNVSGTGSYVGGQRTLSYRLLDYRATGTLDLIAPLYLEAAYHGLLGHAKSAPADFSQSGPELGLGAHF